MPDRPEEAAPRLTRSELDGFVEHHRLGRPGIEALFEIAGARPSARERLRVLRGVLWIGGVVSLAAAVVFFLAANWQALGIFGRFALVHVLLLAAVALSLWRPPRERIGRLAVLGAFLLTGALLALFGQTYQTGADVHELFFTWAAVGLPFVLLAQWSVAWGAWTVVLNVALALLCGWLPAQHVLWTFLLGMGLTGPLLFVAALATNLAAWAVCEVLATTRQREIAAPWLGRLALAFAFAFGTWGAVMQIFVSERATGLLSGGRVPLGGRWLLFAAVAFAAAGVMAHAARRRRDVFPLALVAASAIAIGTALIVRAVDHGDTGVFFALTSWLVASSTGAGWLLMGRVRRWRAEGTLA